MWCARVCNCGVHVCVTGVHVCVTVVCTCVTGVHVCVTVVCTADHLDSTSLNTVKTFFTFCGPCIVIHLRNKD